MKLSTDEASDGVDDIGQNQMKFTSEEMTKLSTKSKDCFVERGVKKLNGILPTMETCVANDNEVKVVNGVGVGREPVELSDSDDNFDVSPTLAVGVTSMVAVTNGDTITGSNERADDDVITVTDKILNLNLSDRKSGTAQGDDKDLCVAEVDAGMQNGNAGMQQGVTGVKKEDPGVKKENTGVIKGNAGMKNIDAGMQQEVAVVKKEDPEVKKEDTGVIKGDAGMQKGDAAVKNGSVGVDKSVTEGMCVQIYPREIKLEEKELPVELCEEELEERGPMNGRPSTFVPSNQTHNMLGMNVPVAGSNYGNMMQTGYNFQPSMAMTNTNFANSSVSREMHFVGKRGADDEVIPPYKYNRPPDDGVNDLDNPQRNTFLKSVNRNSLCGGQVVIKSSTVNQQQVGVNLVRQFSDGDADDILQMLDDVNSITQSAPSTTSINNNYMNSNQYDNNSSALQRPLTVAGISQALNNQQAGIAMGMTSTAAALTNRADLVTGMTNTQPNIATGMTSGGMAVSDAMTRKYDYCDGVDSGVNSPSDGYASELSPLSDTSVLSPPPSNMSSDSGVSMGGVLSPKSAMMDIASPRSQLSGYESVSASPRSQTGYDKMSASPLSQSGGFDGMMTSPQSQNGCYDSMMTSPQGYDGVTDSVRSNVAVMSQRVDSSVSDNTSEYSSEYIDKNMEEFLDVMNIVCHDLIQTKVANMVTEKPSNMPPASTPGCNSSTANTAGCNIPVSNTPGCNISMSNTPTQNMTMSNTPTQNMTMANTPTQNMTMANTPRCNIPISNIPAQNISASRSPGQFILPSGTPNKMTVSAPVTMTTVGMSAVSNTSSMMLISNSNLNIATSTSTSTMIPVTITQHSIVADGIGAKGHSSMSKDTGNMSRNQGNVSQVMTSQIVLIPANQQPQTYVVVNPMPMANSNRRVPQYVPIKPKLPTSIPQSTIPGSNPTYTPASTASATQRNSRGGNSPKHNKKLGLTNVAGAHKPPMNTDVKKTVGKNQLNKMRRLVATMSRDNIQHQDKDGDTYLHVAVCKTDKYLVQALLERLMREELQYMVNVQNNLRQTPLYLAVSANQPEMVAILIEYKADVNILAECILDSGLREVKAAIHCAASQGHDYLTILETLMKHPELNLNLPNSDGQTALHCAIRNHGKPKQDGVGIINSIPVIEFLIKSGADPGAQDKKSGKTPLMYVMESKNVELIEKTVQAILAKDPVRFSSYLKAHSFDGKSCLKILDSMRPEFDPASWERLSALLPVGSRGSMSIIAH